MNGDILGFSFLCQLARIDKFTFKDSPGTWKPNGLFLRILTLWALVNENHFLKNSTALLKILNHWYTLWFSLRSKTKTESFQFTTLPINLPTTLLYNATLKSGLQQNVLGAFYRPLCWLRSSDINIPGIGKTLICPSQMLMSRLNKGLWGSWFITAMLQFKIPKSTFCWSGKIFGGQWVIIKRRISERKWSSLSGRSKPDEPFPLGRKGIKAWD